MRVILVILLTLSGCGTTDGVRYRMDQDGNLVEDKDRLPDCATVTVTNRKGEGRAPACRYY